MGHVRSVYKGTPVTQQLPMYVMDDSLIALLYETIYCSTNLRNTIVISNQKHI